MFSGQHCEQTSLEDLVNDFNEQYSTSISKQGLHERFNEKAVAFMTSLLEAQLGDQLSMKCTLAPSRCREYFKRVRIKDSTRFALPSSYDQVYKGHGGLGSSAQISIQYEYDLLNGETLDLALTGACRNDQQDSKETLHQIEEGDLLIRDLAYTSQSYLKYITENGAYYLNRLNTTWVVCNEEGTPIDFSKMIKKLNKHNLPALELKGLIRIGKEQLNTRLVASRVPRDVYEKRIRQAEKAAKSKGYQVSDQYKVKAWLNLFVTNVPCEWLNTYQVQKTYGLRWQIELIFKIWKSQARINTFKPMKLHRFQGQLIARLIWLLIHWKALRIIQQWMCWNQIYVKCSAWKFFKVAFRLSTLLRKAIFSHQDVLIWFEKLAYNAEKKYRTETKKGKISTSSKINWLLT